MGKERGKWRKNEEKSWGLPKRDEKPDNIVITGGCGFIGVNLVRYLLELDEDIRIRVLDNFSVGQPADLERICTVKSMEPSQLSGWRDGVSLIEGDILNEGLAGEVCRGADGVVHLAANADIIPSIEDPRSDCMTNVIGTFNYLDACRTQSVPRFVLASSSAPLGEQEPPIHEGLVPRPISPYGASKLCGEAYCSAFYGSYSTQAVCLRFSNVYGPYSRHKSSVVSKFIMQILSGEELTIYGDGTQTRDFIYIDDLSSAVRASLTASGIGGEVFQIATHGEHTVAEVAQRLNDLAMKYLGKSSLLTHEAERVGEVKRSYSDISKARRELGWEPQWVFEKGLEETLKWFVNAHVT